MVLNFREFKHPGGNQLLFRAGEDLQHKFESSGHSLNARRLLIYYCIGRTCSQEQFDQLC